MYLGPSAASVLSSAAASRTTTVAAPIAAARLHLIPDSRLSCPKQGIGRHEHVKDLRLVTYANVDLHNAPLKSRRWQEGCLCAKHTATCMYDPIGGPCLR